MTNLKFTHWEKKCSPSTELYGFQAQSLARLKASTIVLRLYKVNVKLAHGEQSIIALKPKHQGEQLRIWVGKAVVVYNR